MIILFGSYARGDWVEDYQEKYEYVSDFDILIVTKDKNSAKQVKKSRELDKELMNNEEITRTSIIYHSIGFVNDKIERNYYFFVDILKEGIMLYDSGNYNLSEPKNLNAAQRVEKSTEEFERLFILLKKAYIDARYNKNYKIEKEELEYLGGRVALLKDLTERICRERIAGFIDG